VNGERRILFASESGWGHVNPLIAIAGELAARGVTDVWFASNDEHRAAIEAVDGDEPPRFVSLGPIKPEQEPGNWSDETMRSVMTGSPLRNLAAMIDLNLDFDDRRQRFQRMLEVVEAVRPALAVVDLFAYWAIDALTTCGVPYVAICPGLASSVYADRLPWSYPTPLSGLRRHMSLPQKVRNVAFRVGRQVVGYHPRHLRKNIDFYRARVAEGQTNPESKLSQYADGAIAVFSCSVFGLEYPFPRVPANLRMIGTMIGPTTRATDDDGDLADWLDMHASVVYAAFGTVMRLTPDQTRAIVDAAERLGPDHHVLWKLPRSRRHLLPTVLPSNLRVESWVPSQLDVLAHAHIRAFFNHGGANGVHEGLYFGKPQLVLPFWMDNVDNAARIADSGAGLAVANAQRPDGRAVAAQLARLLNEPAFQTRAGEWQRQLREAGGSGAAAEEIIAALDRLGRIPA
jgi:polyene glycosyltransferase